MFILNLILNLSISVAAEPIYFSSFISQKEKVDLKNNTYQTALMVDEDCSNCTDLIKKLGKKCSSFNQTDFTVFATGSKKKLKRKLKPLLKRKAVVWYHHDIMTLTKVGVSALPSYISKDGEMYVGYEASLKAILKDKMCVR